jgi:hypothetical protein
MRKRTVVAVALAGAIAATVLATLPAALAGDSKQASAPRGWNVIAPGKKVYGVVGGGCVAAAKGDVCAATASIFPYTKKAIGAAQFGVFGGAVENPECAGDIKSPISTPGVVCIYLNADEARNVALNGEGSFEAEAFPVYGGNYGFKLRWQANGKGTSELYGIWVYQEPDPNAAPVHETE